MAVGRVSEVAILSRPEKIKGLNVKSEIRKTNGESIYLYHEGIFFFSDVNTKRKLKKEKECHKPRNMTILRNHRVISGS